MIIELGLLQAIIIFQQLYAMVTTSFEHKLIQSNSNLVRNLDLELLHRDPPIHDQVVTVNVILAVMDLLRRDRRLIGYR